MNNNKKKGFLQHVIKVIAYWKENNTTLVAIKLLLKIKKPFWNSAGITRLESFLSRGK